MEIERERDSKIEREGQREREGGKNSLLPREQMVWHYEKCALLFKAPKKVENTRGQRALPVFV